MEIDTLPVYTPSVVYIAGVVPPATVLAHLKFWEKNTGLKKIHLKYFLTIAGLKSIEFYRFTTRVRNLQFLMLHLHRFKIINEILNGVQIISEIINGQKR